MGKSRKKNFFARSVESSNKYFKNMFKEIVQNAKSNSEVDLKILEPDLKEAVIAIKKEIAKEKDGARLKASELKGIITNSLSALKEALSNDENNGLSDDDKDEWLKELEGLDIDLFLDEDDDDEEYDDFSEESEGTYVPEVKPVINDEELERALYCTYMIINSYPPENKIGEFICSHEDQIKELICHKIEAGPVNVASEPDSLSHTIGLDRYVALEIDKIEFAMEDEIDDAVGNDSSMETELDSIIVHDEYEHVDITADKDDLLTDDVRSEYSSLIEQDERNLETVRTIRDRMSDSDKCIVDEVIHNLMEVYKYYASHCAENQLNMSFFDFIEPNTAINMNELKTLTGNEITMNTLELEIVVLLNIDVL